MSQEQPERPQQPINYGDVFQVSGKLAGQAVAPRDAAMMQSAETTIFGETPKGGPASIMESAAVHNELIGAVGHDQFSDFPREQGVSIAQSRIAGLPGQCVVTEFVADQAVGQYLVNVENEAPDSSQDDSISRGKDQGLLQKGNGDGVSTWTDKITIGEALEAAAITSGNKPVQRSDVTAIHAAEATATGFSAVIPGGIAAAATEAVTANALAANEGEMTKIADVLTDAKNRILADKEVTSEDARQVSIAEAENTPNVEASPRGVAAAFAAAARLNEDR